MTLIATGAIDRALVEMEVGSVGVLIQRMHQLIQTTLGQDSESAESDDGLELGACHISSDKKRLTFAGARFDLFVASQGKIVRHRGGKRGIGYAEVSADQIFDETHVDIDSTKSFYLTSDGLIDQIGQASQRSFGKKQFQKLLLGIQELPMNEQKEAIQRAVIDHQGAEDRLDDIAMIGFKVV